MTVVLIFLRVAAAAEQTLKNGSGSAFPLSPSYNNNSQAPEGALFSANQPQQDPFPPFPKSQKRDNVLFILPLTPTPKHPSPEGRKRGYSKKKGNYCCIPLRGESRLCVLSSFLLSMCDNSGEATSLLPPLPLSSVNSSSPPPPPPLDKSYRLHPISLSPFVIHYSSVPTSSPTCISRILLADNFWTGGTLTLISPFRSLTPLQFASKAKPSSLTSAPIH